MSRSRAKRKPEGGRLQTVGLFLTLVAVAVLVGSLVAGIVARRPSAPAPAPAPAPPAAQAPAAVVPPAPRAAPTQGPRVRVQVLNASGRPGLAREATRVLRDRGFDVVEFGNGKGFPPDSSVVLDRVGNLDRARQVADAAGIRRVMARPDANLIVDVTVVLGKDWQAAPAP
jgi:pyruvate/2-oxoglutarate dehydrogenase complex dihydrolipoamide acyltransferase (E2) component